MSLLVGGKTGGGSGGTAPTGGGSMSASGSSGVGVGAPLFRRRVTFPLFAKTMTEQAPSSLTIRRGLEARSAMRAPSPVRWPAIAPAPSDIGNASNRSASVYNWSPKSGGKGLLLVGVAAWILSGM